MLNLAEVNDEIKRLEAANTTYANCEKLAVLYTVKENNQPASDPVKLEKKLTSYAQEKQVSEFVQLASEKNYIDVLEIIDEHMQLIQLLYPKEYQIIMQKLYEL